MEAGMKRGVLPSPTGRMKRQRVDAEDLAQAETQRDTKTQSEQQREEERPSEEAEGSAVLPPSVQAHRASIARQLTPLLSVEQRELTARRCEFEREFAERRAELDAQQVALDLRITPLQTELDRVDLGLGTIGYLRLVCVLPSSEPQFIDDSAPTVHSQLIPPTLLRVAQQRLAIAGLGNARLGAASALSSDLAGLVAFYMRGFDHDAEGEKLKTYGTYSRPARLQFRPAVLPAAGQVPEATGFLLQGHPRPKYNGVYRLHDEHKGWPVLKNTHARYCYCCKLCWRLTDSHDKHSHDWLAAECFSEEGALPVGENDWEVYDEENGIWETLTLTVTLLSTEAEVIAAEQRLKEALRAEHAPKAALALAQLQLVAGISLEGNLEPECGFDGVYVYDSTHEGWPVMKKAAGEFYCYRDVVNEQWALSTHSSSEDMDRADAHFIYVNAPEGPLPVGAHTWRLFRNDATWTDHTLTVAVLSTSEEATLAKQRCDAAFQAIQAPMIAAVRTQLDNAVGVLLEGHPDNVRVNGVYSRYTESNGWPVLRNADGMYCCRDPWSECSWALAWDSADATESMARIHDEEVRASAFEDDIEIVEWRPGCLPTGTHSWGCFRTNWDEDGDEDESDDEERPVHKLTMTLLISEEHRSAGAARIVAQNEKIVARHLDTRRMRLQKSECMGSHPLEKGARAPSKVSGVVFCDICHQRMPMEEAMSCIECGEDYCEPCFARARAPSETHSEATRCHPSDLGVCHSINDE